MFLKKLDFISKRNHFYYEGNDRHKNIPSGIITIISYSLILYLIIILLYDMITKKNFTCFQNKSYLLTDDEKFSISFDPKDKNFFFHYLYLDRNDSINGYLQIIGAMTSDDYYVGTGPVKFGENKELDIYYYEQCDVTDMYNYEEQILDKEIFFKSFCIKKMYKYSEQKIIFKNDKDFVWPKINKWLYNKIPVYSIFIRKCLNYDEHTKISYKCKTNDEIEKYFEQNDVKMTLYFLQHLPNVKDYSNPIGTEMIYLDTYIQNNGYPEGIIHNDITKIVTREGLFNINNKEEIVYTYNNMHYSEVYGKYNLKGIYIIFKENVLTEYYRTYDDFSLVISKVGGINSSIVLIAKLISKIFTKFFHYIDSIDIYIKIKENPQKFNLKKKFDRKFSTYERSLRDKQDNYSSINKIDNSPIDSKIRNQNLYKKKDISQKRFIQNNDNIIDSSNINVINIKVKNTLKNINAKKLNFIEFFYLYCNKLLNKKEPNKSEDLYIYYLRKKIISEEFLFTIYIKDKINSDEYNSNVKKISLVPRNINSPW